MQEEYVYRLAAIDEIAEILYTKMATHKVFTFTGSLGAGKTALIKRLLARAGVQEVVTSPTFTYMIPYHNEDQQTFYHFDLYRISQQDDFLRAGFEEYLYAQRSWAFIEWPESISGLLLDSVCTVTLDYVSSDERKCIIRSGTKS